MKFLCGLDLTTEELYYILGKLFMYLGFNTVQVMSQWVVLWAEETSTYFPT